MGTISEVQSNVIFNKMEKVKDSVYVTNEELTKIQEMNNEFAKAKMAIGDIELQKQNVIMRINNLKQEFAEHERMLISKYGQDSVINIQTGEVTQQTKN